MAIYIIFFTSPAATSIQDIYWTKHTFCFNIYDYPFKCMFSLQIICLIYWTKNNILENTIFLWMLFTLFTELLLWFSLPPLLLFTEIYFGFKSITDKYIMYVSLYKSLITITAPFYLKEDTIIYFFSNFKPILYWNNAECQEDDEDWAV